MMNHHYDMGASDKYTLGYFSFYNLPDGRVGILRLCLVTIFIFYFQKHVFGDIMKKKILVFLKSKTCLVS